MKMTQGIHRLMEAESCKLEPCVYNKGGTMKLEIIEIENCFSCRHNGRRIMYAGISTEHIGICNFLDRIIHADDIFSCGGNGSVQQDFPDWCPLEDKEEK